MSTRITTWGGRLFNLADPQPDMVDIEDIAKALSCICRYTGHCNDFYSVAQHSILMANLSEFGSFGTPLQRLLHDSAEAYINDIATPLKNYLLTNNKFRSDKNTQPIRNTEKRILKVIGEALNVDLSDLCLVKQADLIMLATEVRDLINPKGKRLFPEYIKRVRPVDYPITPWDWKFAYKMFLTTYYELKEKEDAVDRRGHAGNNNERDGGERIEAKGKNDRDSTSSVIGGVGSDGVRSGKIPA